MAQVLKKYNWIEYYKIFEGKVRENYRLIISLKDDDTSLKLLSELGYEFDPYGKTLIDCKVGSYYFWTTNIYLDPDDDEVAVDTIDIHHRLSESNFFEIEKKGIDFAAPLVETWFGIKKENIIDIVAQLIY